MGLPHIALVEDNADNRLLVSAMLEDQFELSEYPDGPSAIAGIAANPPALILMDISLPGMDGTEVLAGLRADPRTAGIPVIALTAHAMAGDRDRLMLAGFNGYFAKPIVDEDYLIAMIKTLIGGAS